MEEGVPSPTGKPTWYSGTVKNIMTNEKYKGDALMQKYYIGDLLTKKKIVNRGEISQYYVEGDHEAIISHETYELVQKEMRSRDESRDRYSGIGIFASRIICGECSGYFDPKYGTPQINTNAQSTASTENVTTVNNAVLLMSRKNR